MLQNDIVSVGSSSIFEEQDEDDISSEEENGCLEVRTITRESTNFKAETINSTIRLVLSEYNVEVTNNTKFICIIADSASVNRRSARLFDVPFVNCLIHSYNLSIRSLTNRSSSFFDVNLSKLIEESNRLARHFRSLKNGTVLRQHTQLMPKLACPTRWSGNRGAVFRYDKLRPFYLNALKHPDCAHIEMQGGDEWDFIVTSKKKLLKTIDSNMLAIQSPMLKVSSVYRSFETILSRKQQWKYVRLDDSYLDLSNDIFQDRHFIRGVIKIQNRSVRNLSDVERDAVKILAKRSTHSTQEEGGTNDDEDINMLDLVHEEYNEVEYINCDFILAGAVDVERLWSKISNLLVDNRMSMSSKMISTIMILKENRSLWGYKEVCAAAKTVREREANARAV